jgi:hypothetical protein
MKGLNKMGNYTTYKKAMNKVKYFGGVRYPPPITDNGCIFFAIENNNTQRVCFHWDTENVEIINFDEKNYQYKSVRYVMTDSGIQKYDDVFSGENK